MIMRHYPRGCGIHRTPGDNAGGRLGFDNNGHLGVAFRMGCGIHCHIRKYNKNICMAALLSMVLRFE